MVYQYDRGPTSNRIEVVDHGCLYETFRNIAATPLELVDEIIVGLCACLRAFMACFWKSSWVIESFRDSDPIVCRAFSIFRDRILASRIPDRQSTPSSILPGYKRRNESYNVFFIIREKADSVLSSLVWLAELSRGLFPGQISAIRAGKMTT